MAMFQSEFWDLVSAKFSPKKSSSSEATLRQSLIQNVLAEADEKLQSPNDTFVFEITDKNNLQAFLDVMTDEELTAVYNIKQIHETIFAVTQRVIDI